MDKIKKFLKRVSTEEEKMIRSIVDKILARDFVGLDCKKLSGHKGVYRIKKGRMRIVFYMSDDEIRLICLDRRSNTTYNFL